MLIPVKRRKTTGRYLRFLRLILMVTPWLLSYVNLHGLTPMVSSRLRRVQASLAQVTLGRLHPQAYAGGFALAL